MQNKSFAVAAGFIRLADRAYKRYFFLLVGQCLLLAVRSVFTSSELSILLALLEAGTYSWLLVGLGLAGAHALLAAAAQLTEALMQVQQTEMRQRILHLIFRKNTEVPYERFEQPDFLALSEAASFSATNENSIQAVLTNGTAAIQALLTLGGIAALTLAFDARLTAVLLAVSALNTAVLLRHSRARSAYWREQLEVDRGYVYYINELQKVQNGKDFRMYTIGRLLQSRFAAFAQEIVRGIYGFGRKGAAAQTAVKVIESAGTLLIYAIVVGRTQRLALSPASITFYVSIALQFSQTMTALATAMMKLFTGLERAEPLVRLVEGEGGGQAPGGLPFAGSGFEIQFRDVCFAYPGASAPVLSHISFTVHNGQTISLVGLNGAGKTTLIKLLCRFYRPTSGDILVNGVSIYQYDEAAYLRQLGTIFQDFKLFPLSIQDNVAPGAAPEQVQALLEDIGLARSIKKWPQGLNSRYGKAFDGEGVELSGGEAQKVALARAVLREAKLLVLDEPTSALDPLAEADFYENLHRLSAGRTTIFVSHRMSSSRFSDKIVVFGQGRICAMGTHEELMAREGLYKDLFERQAKGYQLERG